MELIGVCSKVHEQENTGQFLAALQAELLRDGLREGAPDGMSLGSAGISERMGAWI